MNSDINWLIYGLYIYEEREVKEMRVSGLVENKSHKRQAGI